MKLEEALNICQPNECLGRTVWEKNGNLMQLISSAKSVEELKKYIDLSTESLEADDWGIYEIHQRQKYI